MCRDDLPDLICGRSTRINRGLHSANVALHYDGNQTAPRLLLGDKFDVCRLHHGVSSLNGGHQPPCLDQT
jgi:hypothetical protein